MTIITLSSGQTFRVDAPYEDFVKVLNDCIEAKAQFFQSPNNRRVVFRVSSIEAINDEAYNAEAK